jgi:hypothetical protein
LFCLLADEEFDQLCFDYGLELDDIVSHIGSAQEQKGAKLFPSFA